MALIESELSIVTIKELFELKLAIPEYQRPYSWSVESTNTLFMDIYEAYKEGLSEYRLGSVILHKNNEVYNIVDGQQRITTLSILLYCLGDEKLGLLNERYSSFSENVITNNFQILKKKVSELKNVESFKQYLLKSCTVVKIVTDKEQEAFQFFDSHNSRGKELDPHDLLKSYHLREMNNEEEYLKKKIISIWENEDQDNLEKLFRVYLFPLTKWYKGRNGLGYSSREIGAFKGIKTSNIYNYAIYQKASNIFIEQMNNNGSIEILATKPLNQFQLTQPLIAGKRFFAYTIHYMELLKNIRKKIDDFHSNVEEIPNKRTGDCYIKELYESVLVFFADRFGIDSITDKVMKQLYTWSYSLRLVMTAIYPETINKYAIGKHERINEGIDIFTKISEMNSPEELELIIFDRVDKVPNVESNLRKYSSIWKFLRKENMW